MNRGYVKLWRKSKDTAIFGHDGMWKLFTLCIMKASHKSVEIMMPGLIEPISLQAGQFITGREALHFDYHQGHLNKRYSRKAAPTAITLYRWLLNLEKLQILHIKSCNKYSIITICNWEQYQEFEQQVNNKRTTDEHKQELNKNEKENIPDKILSLRERYSHQELINQAFNAIALTRKSGKVSDSVLLKQLQEWGKYPVGQVESGIQTYLNKNCAADGKGEKYLLGIIRKQMSRSSASNPKRKTPPWL